MGLTIPIGVTMVERIAASIGTVGMTALVFLVPIGSLYWIWMAIQLKSFLMFVVGIAGPLVLITGPIGAYSLLFGIPNWIYSTFG